MAFNFVCTKDNMEYRGLQHGVSQKGNEWVTLIFEDENCNQLQISVPDELRTDVFTLHLSKGDVCMVTFRAVSSSTGNGFLQLRDVPQRWEGRKGVYEDEDGEF